MSTAADAPPAEPRPPSPAGRLLGTLVALAVGVALRVGYAFELRSFALGWEADAFVRAWAGRPWDALNRIRPPGAAWLHHRVGELLGGGVDVLTLRLMAVGVSLAAWIACVELAATMSRSSRIARRSVLAATAFVTWIWALHPTIVAASVRPDHVVLLGGSLCVAVSGALKIHQERFVLGWVQFAAGLAAAVLSGGIIVAIATTVGVVWSLLPVPRLPVAARVLSAVAVAFALGWLAQRGPTTEPPRPWMPDTAGLHGAMALVEAPVVAFDPAEIDPDVREQERFEMFTLALRNTPSIETLRTLIDRWVRDLHGPARFEGLPASWPAWAALVVALLEGLLRGGVLLFAVATLTATPLTSDSAWPRAGAVVAALLFGVLTTVTLTGPFDLAALDLVLVGVAGAGMAGIDPARPGARRTFFVVGGALACIFPLLAWHSDEPPSRWVLEGHARQGESSALVQQYGLVREPGDDAGLGALQAATMHLMHHRLPFVRLPEPALELAWRQHDRAPDDIEAINLLVRALLENRRIDEARDVANDSVLMTRAQDGRARMMQDLVEHVERMLRERGDG